MVAYSLNCREVEPRYGASSALPIGKFKGIIVSEEQTPTKKGDGGMLVFSIQVIEGPFNGSKTVDRLNLWNPNPVAVGIANNQLSAYCHVTGQYELHDTLQLQNRPFIFEMGPQKDSDYTHIVALYDINGNPPSKGGSQAVQQQAPQAVQQQAPQAVQQPVQGGWQAPQAVQQPVQGGWQAPQAVQQQAPQAVQQPVQGGWQAPQAVQSGGQASPPSWANR